MRTTYYEAKTANSTYYVRFIDRSPKTPSDYRPDMIGSAIDVWGRGRFFTMSDKPRKGEPMHGKDATGRIITSPVQSVRRIGVREFLAAPA